MAVKTKEIEKLYYSIGEVAVIFDVNKSLIRFWESEFDILKPKKTAQGNRLFTKKDIEHLRIIYQLVKEKGYTLEGAKKKIKEGYKGEKETATVAAETTPIITEQQSSPIPQEEVITQLQKIRSYLQQLRNSL